VFLLEKDIAPLKAQGFTFGVQGYDHAIVVAQYGYGAVVQIGPENPFAGGIEGIAVNVHQHMNEE
jgi:hypothetical protein